MTFSAPRDDRWFEDYVPGAVHELGTFSFSEADIVEFAKRYDPQRFHIDPVAAKQTPYGGIIASGWHTIAAMMRLVVEGFTSAVGGLGSPGIDELRWIKPVRPGDVLAVRATITESRRSQSKPDRGLVHALFEVRNDKGEVVMSVRTMTFVKTRPTPRAG